MELEAKEKRLSGAEVFLFTDNLTVESAFYNGTSSSPLLFDLVLKLRKLELNYSAKIHLIHVAGPRMVAQGTDVLSRGNLLEGTLAGRDMLSFVPISIPAHHRSNNLIAWFRSWTDIDDLSPLTLKE